jgi:CubicO group peptidase (beta-lactamase class C family)
MARLLVAALALALVTQAPADAIDRLVNKWMQDQRIPGVSIGIVRDGRLTKAKGYGFAELENRVRATPDTVFELASVSKQFTAVATAILVDEGKLSFDDPVSKHVKEAPASWQGMTIRHLLSHQSGLPEFHFALNPGRLSAISFIRYTDAQQLADTIATPLRFKPGEGYQYSNAAYAVAGIVVARVSGVPYQQFVQERILKPIGMENTRFCSRDDVIPNLAGQYTKRGDAWARWRMADVMGSMDSNAFGGLVSNVRDLARWDNALGGRLLKATTWMELWRVPRGRGESSNPALGWFVGTLDGKNWIGHTGHTGTHVIRFPEQRTTLILLTNLGAGTPPPFGKDQGFNVWQMGLELAKLALPK